MTATSPIDPRTAVGRVSLTVRDLASVGDFYEQAVGLETVEAGEGRMRLGAGGRTLVELVEDRDAPPRPPRTTGLFHLALLVGDRAELARSLRRLVAARAPLQGASDHLVSEAIYLADPEGNGIEIYRDRPAEEWRRDGDELRMATLPLDIDDLFAAAPDAEPPSSVAAATTMGHVHLNVADLAASERFYADLLGLEVTAREYPGALFLAAGGYHHHVGTNVWRGIGAPPPPPGSLGLRSFELVLPDGDALEAVAARLRAGGAELAPEPAGGGGVTVRDPSGNPLRLTAAG